LRTGVFGVPAKGRSPRTRRKWYLFAAAALAFLVSVGAVGCALGATSTGTGAGSDTTVAEAGDAALAQAFAEHATDLEVQGTGTVTRILADDTQGDRHQRFIVELASGQTLLVTHNIDVAARVASLQVGDTVAFKGVYEWNEQGGLIHWTHLDLSGSHEAGWIEHEGRIYQ
jgi:hypothetical protein